MILFKSTIAIISLAAVTALALGLLTFIMDSVDDWWDALLSVAQLAGNWITEKWRR